MMQKEIKGVLYHTEVRSGFGDVYHKARHLENRLLTDESVLTLPFLSDNYPHAKEWKMRQNTGKRFLNYFSKLTAPNTVVEIGCGNGWFVNQLNNIHPQSSYYGVDIHVPELEQAARLFADNNLRFVYSEDIVSFLSEVSADVIIFNASLHYFDPSQKLLTAIISIAKNCEIHVLDTAVYANQTERKAAEDRSNQYYTKLGVSQMSQNYFHYSVWDLPEHQILYSGKRSLIDKLFFRNKSPFPWIRLYSK